MVTKWPGCNWLKWAFVQKWAKLPCPEKKEKAGKNTRSVCCCFPKLKLNNNMRKLYCKSCLFSVCIKIYDPEA
jgi:hypothetical protein